MHLKKAFIQKSIYQRIERSIVISNLLQCYISITKEHKARDGWTHVNCQINTEGLITAIFLTEHFLA